MASGSSGSQRAVTQSKEAMLQEYKIRLKRDIKSITENYVSILKIATLKVRVSIHLVTLRALYFTVVSLYISEFSF